MWESLMSQGGGGSSNGSSSSAESSASTGTGGIRFGDFIAGGSASNWKTVLPVVAAVAIVAFMVLRKK